jgi:RNA 2',3'-cyclic 3'-phosphodiesterase
MSDTTVGDNQVGAAGRAGAEVSPPQSVERLFIALPLPDWVHTELEGLSEPLRGVAWTRPTQLHLTLRFLGDTPIDRIERIGESLASIRVESFILPIEGVGIFPPKGPPRTLWVGVGTGHPHLFQLRQRMDDALLAAGIDFDVRFFQPHITLARCSEASAGAISAWLRRHGEFSTAPFRITAFDLCSSRLSAQGAVHTLKRRYPLT